MNEIEELKAELQKFKDMAKKGLDEFKDVGGCWGCGLQLQLNQDMEDIKQLKVENEQLKKEVKRLKAPSFIVPMPKQTGVPIKEYEKLYQTLQEIKECCKNQNLKADYTACYILHLIIKMEENNE